MIRTRISSPPGRRTVDASRSQRIGSRRICRRWRSDVTAFNPQWSPDGTELYFLAYRDGIPNIFRLTLATGLVAQLTSLATGISGITSWSPAMSVASRTGMTSFSVYDSGAYNIY